MSRLTSESNPESGTKSYVYDYVPATCGNGADGSSGDLVKTIDAAGNCLMLYYDSLHRLTDIGSNSGCKRFRYDNTSGVLGSIPSGISVSNVKGRLTEAETDTCAWPITQSSIITDEWFSYTARGETSDAYASTPHSGGYYHTSTTYWPNGVVNSISGPASYFMSWNVDGEGRVYSTPTTGALASTSYNAASQAMQVNFGNGDSDTFSYDPNTGRMTQYQFTINGSSLTSTLSWNANGTLQNQNIDDSFNVGGTQNCAYQYDDVSRIGSANCGGNQLQNPGFESGNVDWSLGGNWSIVNNSSNAQSGSWYLSGSSTTDSGSFATPNGSQWMAVTPGEAVTYGGWIKRVGGTGNIAWDCEMVDANYNLVAWCPPAGTLDTSGGTSWQFYQQQITVSANSAYMRFYAEIHGYGDADASLTSGYFDSATFDGTQVAAQTFSYDAFGNISKSGSPYSFQPTYSPATNRMTAIGSFTPTYDGDGNVTNDGLHTYSWDAYGRPVTIDSVNNLTYDALGRMVEQNRSGAYTQIAYSTTGFKIALLNGQSYTSSFVPLPGGVMGVWSAQGVYLRHPDWLGNSRLASNYNRTVYYDGAYAPFGEPYAQTGTMDLNFTGMDQDTVSGLYDFPAREYSIQGRWPSPDPAGLAAVDPTNPQSWNRYAYVLNAPTVVADPSGLCPPTVQNHDTGDWPSGSWGGGPSMLGEAADPEPQAQPCQSAPWYYGGGGGGGVSIDGGGVFNGAWGLTGIGGGVSPGGGGALVIYTPGGCVETAGDTTCEPGYYSTITLPTTDPTSGNSSWAWTFTKTFVSNLVSPTFYKQELQQGGCLAAFGEGFDQADILAPVLNGSPGFAESAIKGTTATIAANYAASRVLTVPLRSSVVRGILGAGEAGATYFAPIYLEAQGSFGLYKEAAAALKGECH